MDFDEDPFPASLPPRICDSGTTETMEDGNFDFGPILFHPSSQYSNSHESTHKSVENGGSINPMVLTRSCDHSLESSPYSSSSGSSGNQHERNHSTDSSRSGEFDGEGNDRVVDGAPAPEGTLIGATADFGAGDLPCLPDFESSNSFMDKDFDFNNAADNTNLHLDTRAVPISSSIQNPMQCRSGFDPNRHCGTILPPRELQNFPELPLTSSALKAQDGKTATFGFAQKALPDYYGPSVNDVIPNRISQGLTWPFNVTSGSFNAFVPNAAEKIHDSATSRPFASPRPISSPADARSILEVKKLPQRSRVETSFPIELTLHSMPPGISKLHLQNYTMSRAKLLDDNLVGDPKPQKSPDMLELYAMVVCTTAMLDEEKKKRAFIRAAGPCPYESIEDGRSQSGDDSVSEKRDQKPLNGGPVYICDSCIHREKLRGQRKKLKDIEKEILWEKDEAKRIILFNTNAVQSLPQQLQRKNREKTQSSGDSDGKMGAEEPLKLVLPMRIACYCRHHNDKTGFQVIFTIKDCQDNVVTQAISSSIYMTDDHKNRDKSNGAPNPSQSSAYPAGSMASVAEISPQDLRASRELPYRNSYSAMDLHSMQQWFNEQRISSYAVSQNPSYNTSATMTPKPLSRQASPSALAGQQHKRRKASPSERLRRDELAMTKMTTVSSPSDRLQGSSTTDHSAEFGFGGNASCAPSYAPSQGQSTSSMHSPYSSQPTTPSMTDGNHPLFAPRSQSMENLQGSNGLHHMGHTPYPMRQSCASNPASGPQDDSLARNRMRMLANSQYSVHGAMQHHFSPVIHKLTPAEGPKNGGIEVTCLGSGFRQGLEVMFGDAKATTTTFWGESALVCLVPPALQAGLVDVTFKYDYDQNVVVLPRQPAVFKYVDDEQQQLMKHALTLINEKLHGTSASSHQSAQDIINFMGGKATGLGGSIVGDNQQGNNQRKNAPCLDGEAVEMTDLEMTTLSCLNFVDLDDSPFRVNFNAQGSNGQGVLHLSASLGYYRLTAGLLARGANPDIRDNNGMSPMHMASLRGHQQIIRKLRSAGADSTLRTLNGYTPADMASSQEAYDASCAFDHHTRHRSAGVAPAKYRSRASSVTSSKSSLGYCIRPSSREFENSAVENGISEDEAYGGVYRSQPPTPTHMYARSRRNSMAVEQKFSRADSPEGLTANVSILAANPAMSAWRDQLSAQIQQLQQTVHRTLPNIQIPSLPPIPNLPDYQAHSVVRRISSLVPHLNPRPTTVTNNSGLSKEADYRWWEILTGVTSSPPAYEDLYPQNAQKSADAKKTSALRAAGEAFMDQKCEVMFDHAQNNARVDPVDLGSSSLTGEQREQLKIRISHERKVKKLRNDRNLIMIWIPLLILVLVAMLKDRVPQALYWAQHAVNYSQYFLQKRLGGGLLTT